MRRRRNDAPATRWFVVIPLILLASAARADEGGVSFWLPGSYGSFAAMPGEPGWSLTMFNYFESVSSDAQAAAARQVRIGRLSPTLNLILNASLYSSTDFLWVSPGYAFEMPMLGGQFGLTLGTLIGVSTVDINGTLNASIGRFNLTRQGALDGSGVGVGDLYPEASIRWNSGSHNWMTYLTGDIPVGQYDASNLVNFGIGHGAVDAGFGYTYLNERTGHELSAVTGFTYNLANTSTNYQNGVDWHLDWGASQFVSEHIHIGAVGYVYQQISSDTGCHPALCPFESSVIGVGPQIGFIIPGASYETYINLKGYGEFDGVNRPYGWNAWITVSLSPNPPPHSNSQ